jgi:hypothetical protein
VELRPKKVYQGGARKEERIRRTRRRKENMLWTLGYGSILCFIFISWWVWDGFYPFLKKISASDVPRGSVQVLFGHQKQRSPGKFNFSSMKFVHIHQ